MQAKRTPTAGTGARARTRSARELRPPLYPPRRSAPSRVARPATAGREAWLDTCEFTFTF